jgi:hypothetical protein
MIDRGWMPDSPAHQKRFYSTLRRMAHPEDGPHREGRTRAVQTFPLARGADLSPGMHVRRAHDLGPRSGAGEMHPLRTPRRNGGLE